MSRTTWPRIPISDVCEIAVDCVNKTAPSVDYETPFKMIRTTNVKRGFVDTVDVKYVTEEVFTKWTRRSQPEPGDVILTREAPLGEVGRFRSEDQVMLGQRLFHYRANPARIHPEFLAYVLQSPEVQGRIRSKGFGATVEHARVGDCENLLIPVPDDLVIQEWIGTTLAAYDDLIENNRRRIKLLEEAARLIYCEWFLRLRFPGHELTKIENGLPKGWIKSSVAGCSDYLSRGISPTYDDDAPGLVINQKCIRDGLLDLGPARRQSKKVPPQKQVQIGDVIVNSTGAGTLGRVAQVVAELQDCTVDSHVTIVRPNPELSSSWFGLTMLSLQPVIEGLGKGATNQTELSKTDLGELKVVVPDDDTALRFEETVSPLRRQTQLLRTQMGVLQRARDLLLPRLMSGEIEV